MTSQIRTNAVRLRCLLLFINPVRKRLCATFLFFILIEPLNSKSLKICVKYVKLKDNELRLFDKNELNSLIMLKLIELHRGTF